MSVQVDLQLADEVAEQAGDVPPAERFEAWVAAAASTRSDSAEVSVRVVAVAEGRHLNGQYRGKDRATNVLAFPADLPAELGLGMLGDLVICRDVVESEARDQGKEPEAHWAHLVVHGTLHLLGYDHQDETDAAAMEAAEIQILRGLGYSDPYVPAGHPPGATATDPAERAREDDV
jgi:probable rRNA maturation factor